MDKEILLTLGRVVYINFGPLAGKLAVVVDIVNGSRVIIDGPTLGVERQMISNKRLTLTRYRIPGVSKAEKHVSLQ
jgi:large subunit ribosomal protein L14e